MSAILLSFPVMLKTRYTASWSVTIETSLQGRLSSLRRLLIKVLAISDQTLHRRRVVIHTSPSEGSLEPLNLFPLAMYWNLRRQNIAVVPGVCNREWPEMVFDAKFSKIEQDSWAVILCHFCIGQKGPGPQLVPFSWMWTLLISFNNPSAVVKRRGQG